VSVTPEENLLVWQRIREQARPGAAAAATAAAKYLMERTRDRTLRRRSHGPGQYYRSPRGDPPAFASGKLARSMFYRAAYGNLTATAAFGNTSDYGRVLEYGCVLQPTTRKFMHWVDSAGSWYHTYLEVPPHPYVGRTTDEAIDDGELQRVILEAFGPYDP
jgi:hypothetical protein